MGVTSFLKSGRGGYWVSLLAQLVSLHCHPSPGEFVCVDVRMHGRACVVIWLSAVVGKRHSLSSGGFLGHRVCYQQQHTHSGLAVERGDTGVGG